MEYPSTLEPLGLAIFFQWSYEMGTLLACLSEIYKIMATSGCILILVFLFLG